MAAVAVSISTAAEAQFVVRIRPVAPVIRVRPVCPSPRHAWVNGEYVWRGDQYVYTEGYWAMPPGRVWSGSRAIGKIPVGDGSGYLVIGGRGWKVKSKK